MNENFAWAEDWKSEGVCRLIQTREAGALWVLVHQNEAAIVEAPFAADDAGPVLDRLGEWLGARRLWVKFFTLSGSRPDRAPALDALARYFDRATFVFPEPWAARPGTASVFTRPLSFPYDDLCEFDLAGEPLVFVRAPFESPNDQLVIFRGVALRPAWRLPHGPGDPLPPSEVSLAERRSALRRVLDFTRGYSIHSHLSAAGHGEMERCEWIE